MILLTGEAISCLTRHDDGNVTVDDWYREQRFSFKALLLADPAVLEVDPKEETITITVANGRAVYRVVERDWKRCYLRAVLIEAEIDLPEQLRLL